MLKFCFRSWTRQMLPMLVILLAMAGCDALGGLFQPGVTIVVENGTGFTAVPDVQMSDSRNILEDTFRDSESVSESGAVGSVAPNQTMTIRLDCDGDLEQITFEGARFSDASGFPFGDADADKSWRRDVDFDCGDTIRIRLSGTVFFFDASTSVERTGGGASGAAITVDEESDDIGSLIDQLLGS